MSEEIYVVLHEDRHIDVEPYLFHKKKTAIAHARGLAGSEIKEQELTDEMERDGWVFYAIYSTEGDSVTVLKRSVSYE